MQQQSLAGVTGEQAFLSEIFTCKYKCHNLNLTEVLEEKLKFITESTCKVLPPHTPLLPNSLMKGPCPGEWKGTAQKRLEKRN